MEGLEERWWGRMRQGKGETDAQEKSCLLVHGDCLIGFGGQR